MTTDACQGVIDAYRVEVVFLTRSALGGRNEATSTRLGIDTEARHAIRASIANDPVPSTLLPISAAAERAGTPRRSTYLLVRR